jgi:hypothetical protein
MPAPTRGEIEAAVTLPTYQVEYWNGSAWTAIAANNVLDVSGTAESAGGANGVTFGAEATASLTIRLDPSCSTIAWERTRVRVKFSFASADLITRATGVITRRTRDADGAVTWEVEGFNEPIARTAVYSPLFYRRPASTLTSATSIEDPTNGAYRAGLVNYILWAAGGRPSEQAASYPSALFYYRCDFAPITPEWSWAAGENAWDELGRLARACGLVIYQAADGVVTATSALALGGTASYTFDEGDYEDWREDASTGELVGAVRCAYTTRRLQPRQVVYEDSLARQIVPGGSGTYTLDMQQPVYDFEITSGALPSDAITATTTEGKLLTMSAAIVSQSASRLTITVTNPGAETMVISRIQIRGRPIAVVEEGSVTVGSGLPEREVGSDTGVYVQSQFHAERLCTLFRDLYGTTLPTRQLIGSGYDPDRSVGEIVGLTNAAWALSAAPHRITAIRHANTGATMDVDLVPSATLPTPAGTFIIGASYSGGDVRLLSY